MLSSACKSEVQCQMHHMHMMLYIKCSSNSGVLGKFSCVILMSCDLAASNTHCECERSRAYKAYKAYKASSQSVIHLDASRL